LKFSHAHAALRNAAKRHGHETGGSLVTQVKSATFATCALRDTSECARNSRALRRIASASRPVDPARAGRVVPCLPTRHKKTRAGGFFCRDSGRRSEMI
jgi:hypothetical protein